MAVVFPGSDVAISRDSGLTTSLIIGWQLRYQNGFSFISISDREIVTAVNRESSG